MLSKISQLQKDKYHMILYLHEVSKIVKLTEVESRMVVARGWDRGGKMGSCYSLGIKFVM